LTTLHAEVDRFRADSPYDFEMTSAGNKQGQPDMYVTVKVAHAPETPDSWPLITGDILTNLRAALDHAFFQHIRAKKPDLHQQYIQYPIDDAKPQWENKIKWFQRTVSKVVGESQPYRSDPANRPLHMLRVLRDLVNMDKHRELVIGRYAAHAFEVEQRNLYTVVSRTVHKQTPMRVGSVVAEAHLRLAQNVRGERREQIPCNIEYSECIEIPGCAEPQDLRAVMDGLSKAVGSVLDELEKAKC
jgi:hypothetical protein